MRAIARYTFEKWGKEQAVRYAHGLRSCFQILAENPGMGRACDAISSGLHRHELGKHVVFYRLKPGGIRIVRVLHQQMTPVKSHFRQ
jgi:toxin ParE1/3/4